MEHNKYNGVSIKSFWISTENPSRISPDILGHSRRRSRPLWTRISENPTIPTCRSVSDATHPTCNSLNKRMWMRREVTCASRKGTSALILSIDYDRHLSTIVCDLNKFDSAPNRFKETSRWRNSNEIENNRNTIKNRLRQCARVQTLALNQSSLCVAIAVNSGQQRGSSFLMQISSSRRA